MSYSAAHQATQLTMGLDTPAEVNEWNATYSNNGQLVTLPDAGGNVTTHEYDGFDRLHKIRFPNTSGAQLQLRRTEPRHSLPGGCAPTRLSLARGIPHLGEGADCGCAKE